MKQSWCAIFLLLFSTFFLVACVTYEGYSLISIPFGRDKEVGLRELKERTGGKIKIFSIHDGQIVGIVDRAFMQEIRSIYGDFVQIIYENYQAAIDQEKLLIAERNLKERGPTALLWFWDKTFRDEREWASNFRTLDETRRWYQNLAEKYPFLVEYVEDINAGATTSEGRTIFAIKIGVKSEIRDRKIIWIQREWLAGATVNYFTASLIDRLKQYHHSSQSPDDILVRLVKSGRLELIIIPVCNPDGYEYSWSVDRLWRKNRSYKGVGVDLNRNFDSFWGTSGSSSNQHSDEYAGPFAASEAETLALQAFYLKNVQRIALALDFHSYSQLVLWPWSYSQKETHPNEANQMAAAKFIANQGERYQGMKSAFMYPSSGCASDFYAKSDIISLTVELPPKIGGFVASPSEIPAVGKDWFKKISLWVSSIKEL